MHLIHNFDVTDELVVCLLCKKPNAYATPCVLKNF